MKIHIYTAMVKTKETHTERGRRQYFLCRHKSKCTLFQAVARCAVIVESRGWELLARVGQIKCPNRKILLFSVKVHYMIWHKGAPGWESHHFILSKFFTTNSLFTLLSHLFSCPCSSLVSLAPLVYNITSEQIHMIFVANPGASPSSNEDIGGPQEVINTNE